VFIIHLVGVMFVTPGEGPPGLQTCQMSTQALGSREIDRHPNRVQRPSQSKVRFDEHPDAIIECFSPDEYLRKGIDECAITPVGLAEAETLGPLHRVCV
jgi:hypothetical protein